MNTFVTLFGRLVLVIFLLSSSVAYARTGQGVWMEELPEGATFEVEPLRTQDAARDAAFKDAVAEEAYALLHGELPNERKVYLKEALSAKVNDYVVSYRVIGVEPLLDNSKRLLVDVQVNRKELKKDLKKLGVYFTMQAPVAYSPTYTNVLPDTWERLGKLHVLYGVTPDSNAPVALQMAFSEGIWTLSLNDNGTEVAVSQGATLEDAWRSVWAKYFVSSGLDESFSSMTVLKVEGWFATDGVESFDRMLMEWDDILDLSELQAATIKPEGISASWSLKVTNKEALTARLQQFLPGRGLVYEFADQMDDLEK